jgi:serine/threonine-protein kinase RsbW
MIPKSHSLALTLDSTLASVDLAESIAMQVAQATGFDEDEVHKIGVAVREGVINAYNYGNRQDRRKKIFVAVEFEADKMIMHIRDQGPGFDLHEIPDCLAEENLMRTSGRGLFLMRAFMDEFTVQRHPSGGAELIMVKKLPHLNGNGNSE